MADSKITQLTADTTPVGADLLTSVKSPFGAGSNRKVTVANFMQNQVIDWKTTARIAIGNDSSLGPAPIYDGSTYNKLFDFSSTITDFSSAIYWAPFKSYVALNPSIDITGTTIYGHDMEIIIPSTNSKNFGDIFGNYQGIVHFGSGDIASTTAGVFFSANRGQTGASSNANYGISVSATAADAVVITSQIGGNFITGSTSSGTITTNEGIHIVNPSGSGVITNNRGLVIEYRDRLIVY